MPLLLITSLINAFLYFHYQFFLSGTHINEVCSQILRWFIVFKSLRGPYWNQWLSSFTQNTYHLNICAFWRQRMSHNNLIHTQSIWISTRFNVLKILSMQLDISMGAALQILILLMIFSLELPPPLFLFSGLNWSIIPKTWQ